VSSVPAEIAGIGATSQRLRVTPGFDALRAGLGPEEYFVWSRIDGSQTVRELLLSTGLPVDRGISIVTRLRSIGAVLLPNESQPPPASARPPEVRGTQLPPTAPRTATTTRPPTLTGMAALPSRPPTGQPSAPNRPATGGYPALNRPATGGHPTVRVPTASGIGAGRAPTHPGGVPIPAQAAPAPPPQVELLNPTREELAALAEDVEIEVNERRRILALRRLVDRQDPHMMLGVSQGADAKQLKRAYFGLSKEIHPDRYYARRVGSFKEKMGAVFEAASKAYAQLTGAPATNPSGSHRALQQQPQTPQEYAAEVFDRACQLEVGGDALAAMKLLAAAVRIDPQTRYLRRAATCALAAGQPKSAVEYAKKAQTQTPSDPSSARLLATTFRAVGKLADAEDVLVMAMAMKSENDALMNELRHDLADVRRLLAAADVRRG
jgi:hypothetical protein